MVKILTRNPAISMGHHLNGCIYMYTLVVKLLMEALAILIGHIKQKAFKRKQSNQRQNV